MGTRSALKTIGRLIIAWFLPFATFSLLYFIWHYIKLANEDPLMKAVRNKDEKFVEQVLSQGINVNGNGHITPLHFAAEHGTKKIVEILLKYGADVNSRTSYDVTPLHFAAQSGDIEIAKLLLSRGAMIDAKDDEGRTPLDWIIGRDWASPEMLDLLELHEDALIIWQKVRSEEEYDKVVEALRYDQEFRKNRFRKMKDQEYQQYISRLKELR
ncbi:MAG: ankyrin repeat domain-containing protein [Candidatus Glassbacteria bacterium]